MILAGDSSTNTRLLLWLPDAEQLIKVYPWPVEGHDSTWHDDGYLPVLNQFLLNVVHVQQTMLGLLPSSDHPAVLINYIR